ncbi:MAG: 3-oxoacyl-ACP reductase FabG [Firmicutes bacterium]|jgi:3-oxoacyl-[acyl-carrier protein] reductase|nr:3-oxoacyl-ACP reductase FabG [Bacillota bacterium]
MVPKSLAGKVALVTGASRGIGKAIALRLAEQGAAVVVGYRQRQAEADEVVARIVKAGGRAVAIGADLANVDDCRRLLEQTAMSLGAPDIFVNNAGFSLERLVLDTRVDEWDALMKVHLRALFLLSQGVLPAMIRRGWGRIVVISSIWGMVGAANEAAYSAVKAGQIGFAKALAKEVASAGITVNVVAPGAVATEMLDVYSPEELNALAESVPMGRLAQPEEIAAATAFLVSPEAGYISGQVLSPNGAMIV